MPQDIGFGFRFRRPTPVVGATLVVLLVVWVASAIAVRVGADGQGVYGALALQPRLVLDGRQLWSLVTYALLHSLDDPEHLLLNGLVFYFFAPDLEELWGRGRFVLFMLVAAVAGGIFVVGAAAVHLSDTTYVVGFSGVVMGVTIAWGLTFPQREMFLLFFRMRGIHLVYVTLAMQVLTALSFSGVSAAAHFGGMATGAAVAMTQNGPLRRWWLKRRLERLQAESGALRATQSAAMARRAAGPSLRVIQGGGDPSLGDKRDKRDLN
jgi:membrane associated rhomboid family serine protease